MMVRPKNIIFHITDACPYQCVHCWLTGSLRASGLPEPYYLQAARSLRKAFGDIVVVLCGGEPLTRPYIFDLIRRMADEGIIVHLNSNGFLIDREVSKRLAAAGLGRVSLSIDGPRDVHNRIRRNPQAYDRVIGAVDFLKDAMPDLNITAISTLQSENMEVLPEFIDWLLTNTRVSQSLVNAITNPNGPDADPVFLKNESLWPRDICKVEESIDRLIALKMRGLRVQNPIEQFELFKDYFRMPLEFTDVTCLADEVGLLIDSYGNVKLCNYMEVVGSILENDIVEILESDRMAMLRGRMESCSKTACHFVLNCFYDKKRQGLSGS